MSMHLVGPYMTTTKYNRKKKTNNSKRLQKAQEEHEAWLKSRGVSSTQLQEKLYVNGKRKSVNNIPDYNTGPRVTSDRVAGHGPAKERMVYSGERTLLGVATMHKSNMVPIFADKKDDAVDIAQMRRN